MSTNTYIAIAVVVLIVVAGFLFLQGNRGEIPSQQQEEQQQEQATQPQGATGAIGAEESQDWMLSLYRSGITLLRLDYNSLEACLSAGNSYMADESADRFDCGLNCDDSIDLSQGVRCEQVCNSAGCR